LFRLGATCKKLLGGYYYSSVEKFTEEEKKEIALQYSFQDMGAVQNKIRMFYTDEEVGEF